MTGRNSKLGGAPRRGRPWVHRMFVCARHGSLFDHGGLTRTSRPSPTVASKRQRAAGARANEPVARPSRRGFAATKLFVRAHRLRATVGAVNGSALNTVGHIEVGLRRACCTARTNVRATPSAASRRLTTRCPARQARSAWAAARGSLGVVATRFARTHRRASSIAARDNGAPHRGSTTHLLAAADHLLKRSDRRASARQARG